MFKIKISKIDGIEYEIDLDENVVFLGANGSGKTSLAKNIYYSQLKNNSYFIGAHKDLTLPKSVTLDSLDKAKNKFYFGEENGNNPENRWMYRNIEWKEREFGIIEDFGKTLSYVFSKQNREMSDYISEMRNSPENLRVPENFIIEKIQNTWNSLISHKQIKLSDGIIKVIDIETDTEYYGTFLSDGEKQLLYLISQVLCCDFPVIIIDEPEHYLNKAVLSKVWNLLESQKKGTKFIYITHDIDFAISRENSKKFWIKKYKNLTKKWDIEEIKTEDNLSDNMILSILGEKKKILFTEGNKNGFEDKLFSILYEDYKIIPLKTCHEVIRIMKSLKDKPYPFFKEYSFYGIIDKDYLEDKYIEELEFLKILNIAEIENLFITPEVLNILCEVLYREKSEIEELKKRLFKEANEILDDQIINCLKFRLKNSVQNINISKKAKDENKILNDLQEKTSEIINSIPDNYIKIRKEYEKVLDEENYEELLKLFNHKGFLKLANNILKIEIPDTILRFMLNNKVLKEKFSKEFFTNIL